MRDSQTSLRTQNGRVRKTAVLYEGRTRKKKRTPPPFSASASFFAKQKRRGEECLRRLKTEKKEEEEEALNRRRRRRRRRSHPFNSRRKILRRIFAAWPDGGGRGDRDVQGRRRKRGMPKQKKAAPSPFPKAAQSSLFCFGTSHGVFSAAAAAASARKGWRLLLARCWYSIWHGFQPFFTMRIPRARSSVVDGGDCATAVIGLGPEMEQERG